MRKLHMVKVHRYTEHIQAEPRTSAELPRSMWTSASSPACSVTGGVRWLPFAASKLLIYGNMYMNVYVTPDNVELGGWYT
jgi:hypothetical protein